MLLWRLESVSSMQVGESKHFLQAMFMFPSYRHTQPSCSSHEVLIISSHLFQGMPTFQCYVHRKDTVSSTKYTIHKGACCKTKLQGPMLTQIRSSLSTSSSKILVFSFSSTTTNFHVGVTSIHKSCSPLIINGFSVALIDWWAEMAFFSVPF